MKHRAAVLGSPISHSLSPALHRAAYRVLGLDWEYTAIECDGSDFPSFFATLGPEWMGLSLTMPLKEVVLDEIASADPRAVSVGAGNTVYREGAHPGGSWQVANTDIDGIVRALRSAGVRSVESAELLGAGATARSSVAALAELGARRIRVHARRREPAEEVAMLAEGFGVQATIAKDPAGQSGTNSVIGSTDADVLVSTLPADAAAAWAGIDVHPDTALLDASYHPWPSALAQAWSRWRPSAPVASGRDMLLWQAVAQVGLMTGAYPSDYSEEDPVAAQVAEAMSEVIDE